MSKQATRRGFLQAAGAAATSVSILSGTLLDGVAWAAPLGVRRNLGGMSAADPILLTYRRAIKAMRALPARSAQLELAGCDPWDPDHASSTGSELFHATRRAAMNNGTGSLSAGAVGIATLVDYLSHTFHCRISIRFATLRST